MIIRGCLILMVIVVMQANSQSMVSLLQPSDSRIMALGNSLVADNLSINSISSNPASLVGFEGVGAFYQSRDFSTDNNNPDFKLESGLAAIRTPIGAFALRYATFNWGRNRLEPAYLGNFYDHTLGITYATNLIEILSIGITTKIFDIGNNNKTSSITSTPAFLTDFGILIHINTLISQDILDNKLNIALAIQNLGSKWKSQPEIFGNLEAQKYFRAGCAWYAEIGTKPVLFQWQLSVEYRKLLNADEAGQLYDNAHSDFWGFGLEMQTYEILSLRIGGEIDPRESSWGEAKKLKLRYGVGLNISPKQVGSDIPIYLIVDYGFLPLHEFQEMTYDKKYLSAWSIGVQYQKTLF
jgi:hypothetical protein